MRKAYLNTYNIACALGCSTKETVNNILNEKTGLQEKTFSFNEPLTFPVGAINYTKIGLQKEDKNLFEKLCIYYINNLVNQSNISLKDKNTLLILSTTKGNVEALPNMPNEASLSHSIKYIQNHFKTANTPLLISNACISGVSACIYAADLIKTQQYDHIIVCAADVITNFVVSGFNTFQALSSTPCQPYDKNRKGLNIGEACAVALISNEKSDIEILGGATSNDANHISGPSRDGSGLALAISKAIKYSQITAHSIDFINAHGTATNYNDLMESKAFESLQLNHIPLNSLKGYIGHTLGAAGLLEIILCAEMMKNNVAFSTLNCQEIDENIKLNIVKQDKKLKINTLLKTASGFGGCNAAIILKHE